MTVTFFHSSAVALRWDAEFRFKLRLYLPISKSSPWRVYLRFTKLMQDLGKKKKKIEFKPFAQMHQGQQKGLERVSQAWLVYRYTARVLFGTVCAFHATEA